MKGEDKDKDCDTLWASDSKAFLQLGEQKAMLQDTAHSETHGVGA